MLQYFEPIPKGQLSTLEGQLSSLIQSAAVCAANKCVQAAQLEEGGKGKVHTINSQMRSKLRHVSGMYTYENALAGFILTRPTVKCGMDCGMDSFHGLIPRTHRKWKYALISCRNDHFAHYQPLQRSRSLKLAVILKQPTISFWSLTVWVSCHCELLLSTCGDCVLGWSDLDFRTVQLKTDRPWTKS